MARGSHRRTILAAVSMVVLSLLVVVAVTLASAPTRWSPATVSPSARVSGSRVVGASASAPAAPETVDPAVADSGTSTVSAHAVGMVTVVLVDESRGTPARGGRDATSERRLVTTIRYPAQGDPDASERTAQPVSGRFPLVVLAHGFAADADDYAPLAHALAAAGFVVAAPEFPASSSAIAGAPDRGDLREQARDVSFIISALSAPDGRPAQIANVAGQPVAVLGHSDGGITTALAAYASCCADGRIGAAVVLSGAELDAGTEWFAGESPPLLAVHGDADEVNPPGASAQLYHDATGPRWLVSVPGGGHSSPFTVDAVDSGVAALVVDFLRAILSDDPAAAARLETTGALESGLVVLAHD